MNDTARELGTLLDEIGTFPHGAAEPVRPTDVEGWLRYSIGLLAVGEQERSSAALDTAGSLGPDSAQRVAIADHRLRLTLADGTDLTAAQRDLVAALREAGRTDRADAEERYGELLHRKVARGNGFSDDEIAVLRTLAVEHPDARIRSRAWLQEARFADDQDDLGTGEQRYRAAAMIADIGADTHYAVTMGLVVNRLRQQDRSGALLAIETHLSVDDNPGCRAALLRLRSQLLAGVGEFVTALVAADEALTAVLGLGCHGHAADLARLGALISAEAGNHLDVVPRWRLAIRAAESADIDVTDYRFGLAQVLVDTDPDDAAGMLRELVDSATDEGRAAEYLTLLGVALRRTGDDTLAHGILDRAVELAHRAQNAAVAARAGQEFGALLFDHADPRCRTVLDRAVSDAREVPEELPKLVEVLHLRGRVRCAQADAGGLDDLDEAARSAAAVAPPWVRADITDSRARGLAQLGRLGEAVPVGLQAADGFSDAGDPVAAGAATLFVGQVLADQGRDREAVAVLAGVLTQVAREPELHEQACALAGDCYERLGRSAEAAAVRARIGT